MAGENESKGIHDVGRGNFRSRLLRETVGDGFDLWAGDDEGDVEHVVAKCLGGCQSIANCDSKGHAPSKQ